MRLSGIDRRVVEGRRAPRVVVAALSALALSASLLSGCAAASSAPSTGADADSSSTSRTPEPPRATVQPTLTVADIAAAAAEAEWSFAPDGLGEPFAVALSGGTATDEYARTYEMGDPVGADVNADGIVDAAIPLSQLDGNAVLELWYVWLGRGLDAAPEQVVYPIARSTRCGDVTRSVTAVDGGLEVDIILRMPYTDDARPCSEAGTGTLTRVVAVSEIDGVAYPIQSEPVAAWGGICPPSDWLDGVEDTGISGRAAPPASAPVVTDPDRSVALFELPGAPLVTASGASFFGFIQDDSTAAVKMHCAFAN
jgi:hypothetical protein